MLDRLRRSRHRSGQDLYGDLFGWAYAGGEPEYGGYLNCLLDGRPAAGMGPQQDPDDPPRWTTYFATEDADATAARITDSGGTVLVPPMGVGPMGRMVIALDPQHHPFGLWEAGEHTGVEINNQPGSLVWNDAAVYGADAGRAFYATVFGWHYDEVPDAGGYTTFALDDAPLGGLGGPRTRPEGVGHLLRRRVRGRLRGTRLPPAERSRSRHGHPFRPHRPARGPLGSGILDHAAAAGLTSPGRWVTAAPRRAAALARVRRQGPAGGPGR